MKLRRAPPRMATLGRRIALAPKMADPFYLSREWRALTEAVKRERCYLCEGCGRQGGPGERMVCDHVVEIADGGERLDRSNLRVLCAACHARKTADAAVQRRMARG